MSLEKLRSFIKENRKEYIELEKILTSHKAMAPENGGEGELDFSWNYKA